MDIIAFLLIMFGLLVAAFLIGSGGSLTDPVTYILAATGVALESWLLKVIYDSKGRRDQGQH